MPHAELAVLIHLPITLAMCGFSSLRLRYFMSTVRCWWGGRVGPAEYRRRLLTAAADAFASCGSSSCSPAGAPLLPNLRKAADEVDG